MLRSCVICRKRLSPTDLYRFQLDTESRIVLVERRASGRSAWICTQLSCIQKLDARPQIAQRALRQRPQGSPDIKGQIKFGLLSRIKALLQHAHRSGQLFLTSADKPVQQTNAAYLQTEEGSSSVHPDVTIPRFILPESVLPTSKKHSKPVLIFVYRYTSKSDLLLRYLQEHGQMG